MGTYTSIHAFFEHLISYLASGVEGLAALILMLGILQAAWHSLALFFTRPPNPEQRKTEIRQRLARWLSLSLEFALAADILLTTISPTWDDIGKLAAIATLRTMLNYSLEREIQASGQRLNGQDHAGFKTA